MIIDPKAFDLYTEKFEELQKVIGCGEGRIETQVDFVAGVEARAKQHKASARLMDCGIKLEGEWFLFGPFRFSLSELNDKACLYAAHSDPGYPLSDLDELIELLFEREVLVLDRHIPW